MVGALVATYSKAYEYYAISVRGALPRSGFVHGIVSWKGKPCLMR